MPESSMPQPPGAPPTPVPPDPSLPIPEPPTPPTEPDPAPPLPDIPQPEPDPVPAMLTGADVTESINPGERTAALIDIDGTLVDSTYLHASAWSSAIRACGFDVPTSRAHRLIGMRGERLLEELLGERDAASVAEQAIDEHARRFAAGPRSGCAAAACPRSAGTSGFA